METTIVKILGIAPNEKMQFIMQEISSSHADLIIDAYVGNLYEGVEHVKNHIDEGYDVILSRGETASMIREISLIPVLEIPYTLYDVLHAVKLAETFRTPFAILGFPSITSCARQLRDMFRIDLDIYTLHSPDEAPAMVQELKEKGYQLIITCMCIDYVVRRFGLNNIPVTSGEESVKSAIDQAFSICKGYSQMKRRCQFLDHIIQSSCNDTLVYNQNQKLIYSSVHATKTEVAISLTQKDLSKPDSEDIDMVKLRGSSLIRSSKRMIHHDNDSYTAFYLKPQKTYLPSSKNDILYYTRDEAGEIFLKHFNEIFQTSYQSEYTIEQMVISSLPLILTGEIGTGKEQLAAYVYTQGKWSNHPYIIVDFNSVSDKSWNFISDHIDSPLNSNNYTIYFRGLEALSPQKLERLITLIRDSHLCVRNRIIFSYAAISGKVIPGPVNRLMNLFSCISANMPPLRQRADAIHTLAGLYVSTLNMDLAKQVIGFTEGAMKVLQDYTWPSNLNQFKRVISYLIAASTTAYIQKEPVVRALAEEERNTSMPAVLPDTLNLKKPLAEIERDIVKAVLAENGGNQSKAAIRLGICRTTLWRIINKA